MKTAVRKHPFQTKRFMQFTFLFLLLVTALNVSADAGIATGPETGTNYPMGIDIQRVCTSPKLPSNKSKL